MGTSLEKLRRFQKAEHVLHRTAESNNPSGFVLPMPPDHQSCQTGAAIARSSGTPALPLQLSQTSSCAEIRARIQNSSYAGRTDQQTVDVPEDLHIHRQLFVLDKDRLGVHIGVEFNRAGRLGDFRGCLTTLGCGSTRSITVGKGKTQYGTGRQLPLDDRAAKILEFWAGQFPERQPDHYVFLSEKYGAAGNDRRPIPYMTDPTKPIGRWKEAWEAAKIRAGVKCRFHDLRHTGCTRMLEAGVPFSVVAVVMGWSAATTIRMTKRYGHISQAAQREAMNALSGQDFETSGAQNWAQSARPATKRIV